MPLSNLPILGLVAIAAILVAHAPELYQRSVQEDGILEWMTFWTFLVAAGVHGAAALGAIRDRRARPWFVAGLGVFCLLVAGEEISWGQRLFAYRPPEYFLAENYQQELNLHNTLGDTLRQSGFLAVCWGYGVLLPLAQRWTWPQKWLARLDVRAPALGLVPSFAATGLLYQVYPWSHTGEWAEAMLGTAMLFDAVIRRRRSVDRPAPSSIPRLGRALALAWLATILLGGATAALGPLVSFDETQRIETARRELEALREDVAAARTRTRCDIHKRVFTMVEAYRQDHLFEGRFASLAEQGMPAERARYFLDPWNSPYWVNHVCSADRRRRAIFVYSFGPDRRRDSTDWQILGDDLGAWISRPRSDEGG